MMYEESIYNLIPKEAYNPPKQKRYKSQHPHNLPPTATTFGLKTTSKIVGNFEGGVKPGEGSHKNTGNGLTFGKPKGAVKPDTKNPLKKQTGTIKLPEKTQFKREDQTKKAAVPKKDEKPIMGLVSDKNYIVANAVENILAAPKMNGNKDKDYLKKRKFGKVPQYMQKIKQEIDDEYELVREMQIEEENEKDKQKFLLPENERQELIAALKKKWEIVHKQY